MSCCWQMLLYLKSLLTPNSCPLSAIQHPWRWAGGEVNMQKFKRSVSKALCSDFCINGMATELVMQSFRVLFYCWWNKEIKTHNMLFSLCFALSQGRLTKGRKGSGVLKALLFVFFFPFQSYWGNDIMHPFLGGWGWGDRGGSKEETWVEVSFLNLFLACIPPLLNSYQ